MNSQLPNGREFFRDFTLRFSLVGISSAMLILLYMSVLLRLPPDQSRGLYWTIGGIAVAVTPLFSWLQARFMEGLTLGLDKLAQGVASASDVRLAFAIAVDLPRRCALFCLANYLSATVLAIVVMYARFDFTTRSALLTLAAGASGGILANVIQFFVLKRIVHVIRTGLADLLPDPEERDRLVHRVPLVHKIAVVLMTVALVPVVFSVFLAQSRSSNSAEAIAVELERKVLDRAVEGLSKPGNEAEVLANLEHEAARFGIAVRLEILDASAALAAADEAKDSTEPPGITDSERAFMLLAGTARGDAGELQSSNIVSWVRTGDDSLGQPRLIAASMPRTALVSKGAENWLFAAVVACSAAVALLIAWLMARDVGQATRALEEQAGRVADGDLRPGQLLESEDELGGVGRSFSRMATSLRTTVGSVVEAANRVEASGATIRNTVRDVTASARDQARVTEQCVNSVVAVRAQALAISGSASALRTSSEESSSSVLQMSAAGEQLYETASVLSAKVDEVATAIEESTRSIAEVNENTAALSNASEETSSSMEEMAAAMRQVDVTAEETARLSGNVIEAAELGQRRVRETVSGMESIRRATDTAERVINGLGDRAAKIGAVLEVINDIANRTNLLALNASIIAAQAGEHGRAFAVVGNEIAELATRVRASTNEIGGLIRSVQQESENAMGAIATGSTSVASGVKLANEAGASLDQITRAARESGERSREIVAAVREQSKAAGHVVVMMDQVSNGLSAIRAATEEQSRGHTSIANAARSMTEVAQQLRATTEEQARGVRQIRENVENVRDSAETIHVAVESQTESCTVSVRLLEELASHTRTNEDGMRNMEEALHALLAESGTLREDVERFKL